MSALALLREYIRHIIREENIEKGSPTGTEMTKIGGPPIDDDEQSISYHLRDDQSMLRNDDKTTLTKRNGPIVKQEIDPFVKDAYRT